MDLHMAERKRHRSGNWPGRLQRYSLRRACVEGAGSQWGTYAFFERRAQRAVDRVVDGCRERIERNTGRDAAWRHPDSAFPYRRRPYVRGYYADTDVLRSKDPFHWNIEDKVGTIDAHASEVVRDERGRWYVSHCGWYQGGLYLAPLEFKTGSPQCPPRQRLR